MKVNTLFDRLETRFGTVNRQIEQSTVDVVRRLAQKVLDPGSNIIAPQENHAGLYVPFSRNNGFSYSANKQVISCAPGTTFDRTIKISGSVIIDGCFIDCFNNEPGVIVEDGGRLILKSCHITKEDNQHAAAFDTYIQVNDGGYLSVSDCMFHGVQGNTGHIIYNYNVQASTVAVLGSVNLTDIVSPFHHVNYVQVVP